MGDYELHIAADGTIKEIHYIAAPTGLVAVMVRQNGTNMLYYTCTDHLGSLTVLTDSLGNEQERYSYDAWGRQRNPEDWTEYPTTTNAGILDRAYEYTGHETLADFGLINMNGRVYDPILARMLSADNYVQSPLYSQNYNRYSYCLNNPLIYKDPSGDLFWLLPYVSFSSHGIEVGVTAGVGIPGVFGATATVGYSSSGGISATAGVFAGPFNAYAGYTHKAEALLPEQGLVLAVYPMALVRI